MGHLYEKYVWEIPVRVTHWVNMLAIVTLSVTGLFIGSPRTVALTPSAFVMGWIRFIHFVAGYTFSVSVLSRIYWALVTKNRYAGWREFFPILTRDGRHKMLTTLKYYTFISRKVPAVTGHNALAGTTYSVIFLLYLTMIGTGFALYSERAPSGILHKSLGWLFWLFSNQGMRLTHHCIMWVLIAFIIHHVYCAWLIDVKERGGVMSGIFSGYKTVRSRE